MKNMAHSEWLEKQMIDRERDKKKHSQMDRERNMQIRWIEREMYRQIQEIKDGQIDRRIDRQVYGWINDYMDIVK